MITFSAEQIDRAVRLLSHLPNAVPLAMVRALNRALDKARLEGARQVSADYWITVGRAKKGLGEPVKATFTRMVGSFKAAGRRPTLYQFGPLPSKPSTGRQKRPQLRVAVQRRNKKRPLPDAFVFVGRSGNVLVGREDKTQRMKSNPDRWRIQGLYGPAIPQMLGVESSVRHMETEAMAMLDARLTHEIDQALKRASR